MKYVVTVAGRRVELSVGPDGIRIGDREVAARLDDVPGTPISLVTVNGVVHRVVVRREEGRGRYTLRIDGERHALEALDERTHAIRQLSAAAGVVAGPSPLKAPMPGLIVRVGVQVGDKVHAGQGVVAIEAMKMENELRAPAAATVKAIHVEAGRAVEKGTLLVEFE